MMEYQTPRCEQISKFFVSILEQNLYANQFDFLLTAKCANCELPQVHPTFIYHEDNF